MAAPGGGGVCVSAGVCPCGLPPHRTAANARDPRRAFPWPSSAGGLLHLIPRRGGIKSPSRAGISLFGPGYRGRRGKRHPGHHRHIGADHVEPPQGTCSRRPRERPDGISLGKRWAATRERYALTRERYAAHARNLTRLWPGHPASVQGVAPLPLPRGPLRLALRDRPAKGRFPNYPVRLPGAASVRKATPRRVFPGFPRSAVTCPGQASASGGKGRPRRRQRGQPQGVSRASQSL